ncbi:hypothetical protein AQUSIP_06440 [Aquicella siphonis]|uniref:Peptidase C58 YopT-type domain-containing protein n=1 Tax=Aquicella siphonis TaxID=254247 RepID=A0A5E4PET6_9COXI|nr:YopT-type cysteine protease domain-containing protein [Aquicella siphonis]VVC75354.1 hypothetical protein AQUSIP_06440 [Aquicella siphonis]
MAKHSQLVLARVLIDIESYQKQNKAILSEEENNLFNELKNRIRSFEHIQRGWLRSSGILANYWKTKKLQKSSEITISKQFLNITQIDLIEESIDAMQHGAGFSLAMMEQLFKDIEDPNGRYHKLARKHRLLFEEIKACVKGVKQAAQSISFSVSKYKSSSVLSDPLYQFANQLGARFILSMQGLDPIRGRLSESIDFEGVCHGHVIKWKDEVESAGKYLALPRHDEKTFSYQNNQGQKERGIICKNVMDIWEAVDNVIASLDTHLIYKLSFNRLDAGHAMGLRKLKTGEIEFFDPNLGLFVFKNSTSFRAWIIQLFLEYRMNHQECMIGLNPIGKQPKGAVATIPELQFSDSSNVLKLKANSFDKKEKVVSHSAVLSAYCSDLQDEILVQQDEMVDSTRSRIYSEIEKLKQNKVVQDGIHLKSEKNNQDKYHLLLKERAIHAINAEIGRLHGNIWGNSESKIDSLRELRWRIHRAHPSLSLSTVVDQWLSDKPKGRQKTHRQIIQDHRIINDSPARSYDFVRNFVSRYEINPASIRILQAKVLDLIVKFMSLMRDRNELPSTFNDIINILSQYNHSSLNELIGKVKQRCSENYTGFFVRIIKGRKEEVDSFYQVMRNIQPHHHQSLLKTSQTLQNLLNQMQKQSKHQSSMSRRHVG